MGEITEKKDIALFRWGLMNAIWECNHKSAMEIVETGIDLNFQNENGYTPVFALTYMHQKKPQETDCELMKMMLDRGANPDTPNYRGEYPLQDLAAGGYFDDLFKLMLDYNPNIHQSIGDISSCELICKRFHPEIIQLLKDKGLIETDIEKMDIYQLAEEASFEDFKKRYKSEMLNQRDSNGDKIIFHALHGKKWETVYFLLQQSDEIDQKLNTLGIGDALGYVINNRKRPNKDERTKSFKVYDEILKKIIKYYVEHGADLNAATVLVSATPSEVNLITDDEMEMINYLLDHGAVLKKRQGDIIKEYTPILYEYYKEKGVILEE